MRIYEEVRDAWEEREQMGSHCKCKQIYGISNLLWEASAPQGTILLAAVARSHHTLAPIPFYSRNKHWGGGQWPHRGFSFQCSVSWGSVTETGRTALTVPGGTSSYRKGVLAQCLSRWETWIGVFPIWGMLQISLCALCFPLTLFCSSEKNLRSCQAKETAFVWLLPLVKRQKRRALKTVPSLAYFALTLWNATPPFLRPVPTQSIQWFLDSMKTPCPLVEGTPESEFFTPSMSSWTLIWHHKTAILILRILSRMLAQL